MLSSLGTLRSPTDLNFAGSCSCFPGIVCSHCNSSRKASTEKTKGADTMKMCKCGAVNDSKLEKEARCRCFRQTFACSQNPHMARQLRTGRSEKRRTALAGFSKEQLVSTFLELETRVTALEMQVEAVRKAEEEIAEVGEEEYDFSRGEFPMSRFSIETFIYSNVAALLMMNRLVEISKVSQRFP